jgi:aspartate/methionine/tyrosine aminotransferase
VAKYTERFILLVSSSKLFSYAGQRIGLLAVSDSLFETRWPDLKRYFTTDRLGHALVFGAAYAVSAGVNSSSQFGLAAILEKTAEGEVPLLEPVKIYGRRAAAMKSLFLSQGFRIVYDLDVDQPIGDGFYFTVSYPGFSGEELVAELLYYGISAISLATTGSERLEGIRACVSRIEGSAIPILKERLERFHQDHRR